jgi:hypothetical protein
MEVSGIATILTVPVVLGYLLMSIIVDQESFSTGQRLGVLHLIGRPVTKGVLAPMVSSRWFHYNDLAQCISPLLGQCYH